MLVGCNKHGLGPTNLFLENKELTQLKGRHILDMEKYTGGWSYIDIGMFSNKYYLQYDPREVLSVERSCNFWGCSVVGVNYSTREGAHAAIAPRMPQRQRDGPASKIKTIEALKG